MLKKLFISAAIVSIAMLIGPLPTARAKMIVYYYKDAQGTYHFTNKPKSRHYRVYAIFGLNPKTDKEEIHRLADKYGAQYELDACLIQALIEVESNYNVEAVSIAGAQGLMQIMPETQKDLGVSKPFDPEENVHAGVRYLKDQIVRFGDLELALAAYNAGPEQVKKYKGIPPFKETQEYVEKVTTLYKTLKDGVHAERRR